MGTPRAVIVRPPQIEAPGHDDPFAMTARSPTAQPADTLNAANYGRLQQILRGSDAARAFQDGGEAGYQDYVREHLADTPGLARFVMAPPVVVGRRLRQLGEATDTYAEITARQRQSYGVAQLAHERQGNRLQRFGRRLAALILNPIELFERPRVNREEREGTDAATAYRKALHEYVEAAGGGRRQQLSRQLGQMAVFEARVRDHEVRNLRHGRDAQGNPAPNRRDRTQERVARWWDAHNKAWRLGAIAVPAAIGGGAIGVVVGVLGTPVWGVVLVGLGVGVGAKAAGSRVADSINRYRTADPVVQERAARQARTRADEFATFARTHNTDPRQLDVTAAYASGTRMQSSENLQRRRRIEAIGATAAALAFSLAYIGANAVQVASEASRSAAHGGQAAVKQPSPSSTPTSGGNSVPTPPSTPHANLNTPPVPANIGHIYPWDAAAKYNAAHHLSTSPSGIWDTLRHATTLYNQTHPGAHYHYVLHGAKYWLQNGAQTPTWAVNADFNKFLWYITAPAHAA